MAAELLLEKRAGIARITFNRPAVKNALTPAMCLDIAAFITELRNDDSVRVLVITGTGPDFTAGADLRAMAGQLSPSGEERGNAIAAQARELAWPIILGIDALPQPVIASVRGHAIGIGGQFVIIADLVVASETMKLRFPNVHLAHSVDHGESYYLPRKVGAGRAMQLLLLGETIAAAEAERYGLVNWVVPDGELEERTERVARTLAGGANIALRGTKALLRQSADSDLPEQLAAEERSLRTCAASGDFVEAIRAFGEKRAPVFKGC